jgi:hypothetical protein
MMQGEPVWTKYCGYMDAHLIEAMSINGLSGSPVFVNIGAARVKDGKTVLPTGKQFLLFGLMHGHFDIKNLNEDVVADNEKETSNGLHTGIGVVVPVKKIIETIFQPELVEMRRKAIEDHRNKTGAVADVVGDGLPANDENPTHREDFMRLVGAAAQKQEPKD